MEHGWLAQILPNIRLDCINFKPIFHSFWEEVPEPSSKSQNYHAGMYCIPCWCIRLPLMFFFQVFYFWSISQWSLVMFNQFLTETF